MVFGGQFEFVKLHTETALCLGARPPASKMRPNLKSALNSAPMSEFWRFFVNPWDGLRYLFQFHFLAHVGIHSLEVYHYFEV